MSLLDDLLHGAGNVVQGAENFAGNALGMTPPAPQPMPSPQQQPPPPNPMESMMGAGQNAIHSLSDIVGNTIHGFSQVIGSTPVSQGASDIQHFFPTAQQAAGNVGSYLQNRVIAPAVQMVTNAPAITGNLPGFNPYQAAQQTFPGILPALNQHPNVGAALSGAYQTAGNLIAPEVNALFSGIDATKGAINAARTGADISQGAQQAFTGQNVPSLGTAVAGNTPVLTGLLNAGEFAAPLVHGGVSALMENPALALKDVSPNAWKIHPDDQALLTNVIGRAQAGEKVFPEDLQDLQNLAEHYLGEKWRTASTPKIMKAFDYVLAAQNGGEPGKFPKLGLVGDESSTPEETTPPTTGNPEPLPWENDAEAMLKPREMPPAPMPGPLPLDTLNEPKPAIELGTKAPPSDPAVDLNAVAGNARAEMYHNQGMVYQRAQVAQQAVEDGVKGKSDTALFRRVIEHPETMESAMQEAKSPTKFAAAVQAFRDYTEAAHNALTASGSNTGHLENYYPHMFDLSDPEKAAQYEQIMQAKAKNYSGFYNRERVFNDLDQAAAAGFLPKNSTVVQDIADHASAVAKEVGANTLTSELKKNAGSHIYTTDHGEAPPINFHQSTIPGMKGTYVSQALNQHIKDLEPVDLGKAAKAMDYFSNLFKSTKLAGGGFHILNTGLQYLGTHASYLDNPRLGSVIGDFFSPAHMASTRDAFIKDGTMDDLLKSKVTLNSKQDFGDVQGLMAKMNKANPLDWLQKATFTRLEDSFKMHTFQMLRQRGLIDTSTPEGLQQARRYGEQINNLFGGQNRITGDSVFKNKISQFLARQGLLAPDFQEGRIKNILSAVAPIQRTGADNFALRSLIGKLAATAVLAEVGRKLTTGQFSTSLAQVVRQDLFDPQFQSPWQSNGKKQDVHLPGTPIADIERMIGTPGQVPQNIERFGISHLGAGASNALQYLSNQNYYGAPLSQTNNPLEKAKQLALGQLPIPVVQGQKVLAGSEDPHNAVINIIGGRVSTDPNDPSVVYAKARQAALLTEPKPVQDAYASLEDLKKMDPNSTVVKAAEAQLYRTNPGLFAMAQQLAYVSANGDESKVDPLYRHGNEQLADKVNAYNALPPGPEKSQFLKNNPDVSQMEQDRAAFRAANPYTPSPTAAASTQPAYMPGPAPSPYVQQQMNAKNWNDPQVQQYLQASTAFKNTQRAQWMLAPVDSYGNIQGSKNYGVTFGSGGSSGAMPASLRRRAMRELKFNDKARAQKANGLLAQAARPTKAPKIGSKLPKVKLTQAKGAPIPTLRPHAVTLRHLMAPTKLPLGQIAQSLKPRKAKQLFTA